MVYINLSAPPSKRFRYAIARYVAICSGVIALLFSCGPSAVAGLIVPVNINSVESEPSWFFPHISKEVGEIKPPIANRYSSAPILVELRFFAVGTTLNHRPPRLVGTGVRHAMRDVVGIPRFGLETPTGFCSTRCEQVGSSYVQSSANTHAFPLCFYAAPTTTFNLFDGRESPEHLAGEINGAVVQFFCAAT